MHSDAVVNSLGTRFTRWVVGRDYEGLVPGSTQMFEYPQHRVANTVDIGEE